MGPYHAADVGAVAATDAQAHLGRADLDADAPAEPQTHVRADAVAEPKSHAPSNRTTDPGADTPAEAEPDPATDGGTDDPADKTTLCAAHVSADAKPATGADEQAVADANALAVADANVGPDHQALGSRNGRPHIFPNAFANRQAHVPAKPRADA